MTASSRPTASNCTAARIDAQIREFSIFKPSHPERASAAKTSESDAATTGQPMTSLTPWSARARTGAAKWCGPMWITSLVCHRDLATVRSP